MSTSVVFLFVFGISSIPIWCYYLLLHTACLFFYTNKIKWNIDQDCMDFAHRFSLVQLVCQYLQMISLMHAISVIITPTFYVKFRKIVKLL